MTSSTYAKARALVATNDAKRRQIENLKALVEAARVMDYATQTQRIDATLFRLRPERLAGAVALYRRTDSATRTEMLKRYHELLSEMLESPFPGIKPHKVDFAALPLEARPYLLAPFLDLVVGTYPRLDFDQSNPPHTLTYTHTGGPADVAMWKPLMPKVSAWLGATYHIAASTATTITLVCRPDLPREIPMNPAWLVPGHLFLGIDVATHRPYHVPLADMTHTLLTGTTGSGKSVFLHTLLASCLTSANQFAHIHAVCGQGGVAFDRYRGLHPKLTTWSEPADLYRLAAELVAVMKERNARLVASRQDKMADYILLLIDEFGAFNQPEGTDKPSKEAHGAFQQNMIHLGKRGRKVGIRICVTVQEPVERDLATGIRSVLPSVVCFRLPLAAHASAVFGELSHLPADPRTLPTGRALYQNGNTGQLALVQVPLIQPPRGRP